MNLHKYIIKCKHLTLLFFSSTSQLAMKQSKEMEQLQKSQREQVEKLEKFNEQVRLQGFLQICMIPIIQIKH